MATAPRQNGDSRNREPSADSCLLTFADAERELWALLRGSLLALRSIARRVLQLTAEERELAGEIETLTRKLAPQLLDQPGISDHTPPHNSSSPGHTKAASTREAAFARARRRRPYTRLLRPNHPLPPRPIRGDRKLNRALHMILVTRKRTHPAYDRLHRTPTRRKAKHDAQQTAASSATSPAASTGYSKHWTANRSLTDIEGISRTGMARSSRRLRLSVAACILRF